jgi:Asp/Glu/hydantoin racemase
VRFALINPNTNAATTDVMVAIAREAADGKAEIEGLTAPYGAALITNPKEIAEAAQAVASLADRVAQMSPSGVIVSAFGDPGVGLLRTRLSAPVTGIAEAAMLEAAAGGRSFAVVTTTPNLVESISNYAEECGHGAAFRGVTLTRGDLSSLMKDPRALEDALAAACETAIAAGDVDALIIGGGPLAQAARVLRNRFDVPIIEPIPVAVQLAIRRSLSESAPAVPAEGRLR